MTARDPFELDETALAGLLEREAPRWAGLVPRRIASEGTDNAVFRLGKSLSVRIARRADAVPLLEKELDWLPRLTRLPLEVPELRHRGRIDARRSFGILTWVEGNPATPARIERPKLAARDLARFLRALQTVDDTGAPGAGPRNAMRGVALADLDARTREAMTRVGDEIDARSALRLWDAGCAAGFRGPPVWLHGDLKAGNLIARQGRLCGVIDWGLSAVGDPAADYAAAWAWIEPTARDAFRDALEIDADDWCRGRAWALYGAVIALSHYRGGVNEALCEQSRRTLAALGMLA
jgi:aminoglycoside phosphotransferase (APT) family kinase protein